MKILYPSSMEKTLDSLNDAFFYGKKLTKSQKKEAAEWIAGRVDEPRGYHGLPAPTPADFNSPVKVFTGEQVKSMAATSHILGEEAVRALLILDVRNRKTEAGFNAVESWIDRKLSEPKYSHYHCCGLCSPSYWRMLVVADRNMENLLDKGIKYLSKHRTDNGKWRRFPFHYTVYALNVIGLPSAVKELKYAAPVLERIVKRKAKDKLAKRRLHLAERVLEKL